MGTSIKYFSAVDRKVCWITCGNTEPAGIVSDSSSRVATRNMAVCLRLLYILLLS